MCVDQSVSNAESCTLPFCLDIYDSNKCKKLTGVNDGKSIGRSVFIDNGNFNEPKGGLC